MNNMHVFWKKKTTFKLTMLGSQSQEIKKNYFKCSNQTHVKKNRTIGKKNRKKGTELSLRVKIKLIY